MYYAPKPKEKLNQQGNIVYRMRGTLRGDKINYDGETLSTVADPVTINIHQQSVLADRKQGLDARYVTADCSDYCLGCKLERPEYVRIPTKVFHPLTILKYDLQKYIVNGFILFEVNGSMYGHPAAGRIAQKELIALLTKNDYYEHKDVPCLFFHKTRPISFTLVVDDLGIKASNNDDINHLLSTIREK